ncbi:TusE/DsrC/DsvC family sulfur relay protein [Candidatus Purcelliella pentastirinorum]|uniref:Sulfurtransferase n=1 Tax=Candidatus Purcelliella pentastirinorum TaxID=472834 RepID=A0AAX3N7W0_9ENTR|nr:TusE/DsrC/DsvC family sulfur relay protein [Candidatus Purcelliella pentastirinorum]WDI78706.1 TusE/DsrC/DsvC family sulfur relay protein [Candidatus Purcelliella pentastirinorum]WDR80682.1 TusE/DsrC/DsvC family sulfur relay protein [Candidatus Purcelliella pentastirinorum]
MKFDYSGYLKNFYDWNKKIAYKIAKKENILLNEDHWKIIYFIRNFYSVYKILPKTRIIIKSVSFKLNTTLENSVYLFILFPKGIMIQASKIAGIPKPIHCF